MKPIKYQLDDYLRCLGGSEDVTWYCGPHLVFRKARRKLSKKKKKKTLGKNLQEALKHLQIHKSNMWQCKYTFSKNLPTSKGSHRTSGLRLTRHSQYGFCVWAVATLDYWHMVRSMSLPAQDEKKKKANSSAGRPRLGSALRYKNSLSSVSNNMQFYHQCVQHTFYIKKKKQWQNTEYCL